MGLFGDGFGGGWSSATAGFDREHLLDIAARSEHGAENAVILRGRFQHDCRGAVAEQDAGRAIFPVEESAQSLAGNDEDAPGPARLNELARGREGVQKPGAGGVEIEGGGMVGAKIVLDQAGSGRNQLVRSGRGADD